MTDWRIKVESLELNREQRIRAIALGDAVVLVGTDRAAKVGAMMAGDDVLALALRFEEYIAGPADNESDTP